MVDRMKQMGEKPSLHRGSQRAKAVGGRAAELTRDTASKATRTFDQSVSTVTLREYREGMEQVLGEVVAVLTAHDAEIAALRQKVADLESRLAEGGR